MGWRGRSPSRSVKLKEAGECVNMGAKGESLVVRFLRWLADSVYRFPRLYFYPQVVLLALSIYYTVDQLQFSTSRNDLVGSEKKYHRIFLAFKEEFPRQDDLVAVVESEDLEKNRQFVERLGLRLEAETNFFADVFYKGDLKMLGPKALLFLTNQTLLELEQTLKDYRPFLIQFSQATNLNSLFRMINHQFRTAAQEQNPENESLIKALPALQSIVEQARASLRRPGMPPSPGLTALFGGGPEAQRESYITFAQGRIFLVSAQAASEAVAEKAVKRFRELVDQTQTEVPGVNVGITGEPVLEFDEMSQSQHDTAMATVVSLIVVALIFIYGYHETGRPIKATISLIFGLAYTMAFTTFAVGHLNILTITFLPILIGIAIDFGVHLISRYEEELRHGKTEREALEKAMVNTGLGIFTSGLTTAGAFFAMGATQFKGIQEMGIISGGGLIICLIPMLTLLPVLLLRGRQNLLDHNYQEKLDGKRARLEKIWLQRPVWVLVATAVLSLLALTQFHKVYFDYNLLNMQSAGLPAVVYEKKLLDSASKSVLFAAVIADSLDQAHDLQERIQKLSAVASVDSMVEVLRGGQEEKLGSIRRVKALLADLNFAPIDPEPVNTRELSQTLFSFHGYLGLAIKEVEKEKEKEKALLAQLTDIRRAVGDLRETIATGDPQAISVKLGAFQRALFRDIEETFYALKHQDDTGAMRPEDLPAALRHRFIGRTGKLLLQVYPKEDVWQRQPQERFVRQLRLIDKNATGTPVQLYEYTTLLKNSYIQAAGYSLVAIVLLVFFHFRSVSCVILSLLPVAIGSIWMTGLMGKLGIPFNPANIMTLPLVIGIGVTNGIHILNRFSEEQQPSIFAKSTGKAVLVSALTTIAGFGSLGLAKHQGIASLGYVMAMGTATCMIAALTFLPALLTVLSRWGWTLKRPSGDDAHPPLSQEEPRLKPQV